MKSYSMLQQFHNDVEKLANYRQVEPYVIVMELDGEG